jgi:uncharacterized protein YjgD (DUF1641 family)
VKEERIRGEGLRTKKEAESIGYDETRCYTIMQGMTDPQVSKGLTFTLMLFEDFPAPPVNE